MADQPNPKSAQAVADTTHGLVIATVEIPVPIDRVFKVLTTPDDILRWWGAEDAYRSLAWEANLRPGGSWRATGVRVDGEAFEIRGEFVVFDPPARSVFTWRPDWDQGHETTVTYRLETIDAATRVTVRHEGFADRPQECEDRRRGWERLLGLMAAHCAGTTRTAAPATRQVYLLRLIAPRASFADDMTGDERAVMTEHVGYWQQLVRTGTAIAFGPVADPAGAWGLGLVAVTSPEQVKAIEQADPAIKGGIGMRYEALPMPRLITRDLP